MINSRIILLIVLISISDVHLSATGYYRQQHEYQKSQESYINGELQHKSKDAEFYAKQGEIAPETQKPPIKHHFKHHEEFNKDDHLNQQSSQHNQHSLAAEAAAAAAASSHDYIRQNSRINDDSRYSNEKFIAAGGQQLSGYDQTKQLKHEGYIDRYNAHVAGNLYQKNSEPYSALSQQKSVEDHSKFLSGQNSYKQINDYLNKNSHFDKFGSVENTNVKDLTSQCYEAWKMYSLEEMNRNLEKYQNARPSNLQFTAQQPLHSNGYGLVGGHGSELHSSHGQQHSYNYARHESGGYYGAQGGASSSRSSAFGHLDDDIEDVNLSLEAKKLHL